MLEARRCRTQDPLEAAELAFRPLSPLGVVLDDAHGGVEAIVE